MGKKVATAVRSGPAADSDPILRIPVARKAHGPRGRAWFVDAVLIEQASGVVPAFLLRPCLHFAFWPAEVERLAERLETSLNRLLIHGFFRPLRDPLAIATVDEGKLSMRPPTAVVDLRETELARDDRRYLLEAEPWSLLLDEGPAELGLLEFAGMDPVDAALLALMDARGSPLGSGRARGAQLPEPRADLLDALLGAGLSRYDAGQRVAGLSSSGRGKPVSEEGLYALLESGRRARSRGRVPAPVLVPDPDSCTSNLVDWLRLPRTARLLRVVTGGTADNLHIGIAASHSINGWMESVHLPFFTAQVPISPERTVPPGLTPDDIDFPAGRMRVYGFAADKAELVARFG